MLLRGGRCVEHHLAVYYIAAGNYCCTLTDAVQETYFWMRPFSIWF